ncbi:MAG: hypothetical protein AABX89_07050 [Candidatus Thermoplasmatota archaeon]
MMERRAKWFAFAVLLALAAAPVASALPAYKFYFLADTETGVTDDGLLQLYDPLKPVVPNATAPSTRVIFPVLSGVVPVQFLTDANETHPTQLKGPFFMALWPGPSPIYEGNLTATLYEIPAGDDPLDILPVPLPIPTPILPPPIGPAPPIVLAQVSIPLAINASNLPDPMALIPPVLPDPSTDPVAYAQYVAFYELSQVAPAILVPPKIFVANLDLTVNATSRIALAFTLTNEAGQTAPLPVGAFAQIQYNATLSPSYLFLPWYEEDKPGQTLTKNPNVPRPTTSRPPPKAPATKTPTSSEVIYENEKGSPDAGLLLVPALAALVFFLRRRLP